MMILAFVAAGGLLAWLYGRATSGVEVEVVEGSAVVQEAMATVLSTAVFGEDPLAQVDNYLQMHGLPVQGRLGSQAFFVQLPDQPGVYLMKMLPALVADSVVVEMGATVSVTGRAYAMSDSVANSWVAAGAIGETDRVVASFQTSYFEVEEVNVTIQPSPDDD